MLEHKKARRYPVMQWPTIAFFLAIAAGSMDGFTYYTTKSFSTVQSGNIILVGQSIASSDWQKLLNIGLTILSFGIGALLSELIAIALRKKKHNFSANILLFEAAILILLTFSAVHSYIPIEYIVMIIAFVAGMQGNGFHKLLGMPYGNVAVTLVVQNAFSYAASALRGNKEAFKKSAIHFWILIGFAFGGFVGTLVTRMYDEKSLWFTAIILIGLIFLIRMIKITEPNQPIDP